MVTLNHRHHRRQFIRNTGAAALSSGLVLPKLSYGDEQPAAPGPADVGIARGSNMEEAVRKAVELSGGMDFIKEGQTVLIKPNCTAGIRNPVTTSPEVIYAVIKLVHERGAKRIIVSDRCYSAQFTTTSPTTISALRGAGHVGAVEQAKAELKAPVVAVGLEDCQEELELLGKKGTDMWRKIDHPKATHWPNGFELAELLLAVDHVINVPVIKTHYQAWFSMSMKAFVGMSHHRSRREFHASLTLEGVGSGLGNQRAAGARRRLGEEGRKADVDEVQGFVNRIAELNLGLKPSLQILDGTRTFVFGGPSSGDSVGPKLVVASRDRIAADATGVAVLKHYGTERRLQNFSVWDNPFIKHGIKIGLGIDGLDKLKLKDHDMGDDLKGIKEQLV